MKVWTDEGYNFGILVGAKIFNMQIFVVVGGCNSKALGWQNVSDYVTYFN